MNGNDYYCYGHGHGHGIDVDEMRSVLKSYLPIHSLEEEE